MARHLIIGAGPIGRATTTALQKRGHTVTIATRSGTRYGSAESVTLDATDTPALTRAATGCDSIIVCPISTDQLRAMRIIGQQIDVDIITHNRNTLFF